MFRNKILAKMRIAEAREREGRSERKVETRKKKRDKRTRRETKILAETCLRNLMSIKAKCAISQLPKKLTSLKLSLIRSDFGTALTKA